MTSAAVTTAPTWLYFLPLCIFLSTAMLFAVAAWRTKLGWQWACALSFFTMAFMMSLFVGLLAMVAVFMLGWLIILAFLNRRRLAPQEVVSEVPPAVVRRGKLTGG